MFRQNIFSLRLSLEVDVLIFSETSVNFYLTVRHQIVTTAPCIASFMRKSNSTCLKYSDEIIVFFCMGVELRLRHQDQDIG